MTGSVEKSVRASNNSIYKTVIITVFVIATSAFFVYLNNVQKHFYIDEEFHVGQTLRYCRGQFLEWDKKITTLPGLYLVTSLLLGPVGLCSIVFMRCINLLATFANLYLIYKNVELTNWNEQKTPQTSFFRLGVAFSIVLFPPLFFWFFLYYTDVVSLNFVLLTRLMYLRGSHKTAALVGSLAILVRQTNVIWIAVFGAERVVDLLEAQTPRSIELLVAMNIQNTSMHAKLIWNNLYHHISRGLSPFNQFLIQLFIDLRPYALVGISFVLFVLVNGGIVVGDRSAHSATVHIPQIFYYSVFSMLFAWPYMLPHWRGFLHWTAKRRILTSCLFALAVAIVHSNTLVHPYILADNRHYVFYVWNRFMGRYQVLRYLLVPVYGFAIYAHLACLRNLRFLSQLIYVSGVCVVLIPQLLLEPRYFIVPYVFLRMSMSKPKKWQLISELATTMIINFVQFYIFVTKTFYWTDGEYLQRISW